MLACPKCKTSDRLRINALVTVRLTVTKDNVEAEPVDCNYE